MRNGLALLLLVAPWLGACSGDPAASGDATPTFPEEAYATVSGEEGAVSIALRTAPFQPPRRGLTTVEYRISGADGGPLDDVALEVVPWMPAMGHGASTKPVVEALGEGRYLVSKVSFFMPGAWELRSTIDGSVEDRANIAFQIP